ncbi:MAG TPA: phosphotransferase [Streptosporangiaceae bacterium]|nr:phosphotransferase [Streptosporangiaceae bacterium]
MRHPPGGIDERELARVLDGGWGLAPATLSYLPLGFGDHHWRLTDTSGRRWFITVAALAGGWRGTGPAEGLADLRAALGTVTALRRAGLDLAVAPVPDQAGQPLARLGPGQAVTVFPWLDGAAGAFGGPLPERDRLTLVTLLASLHNATGVAGAGAPVRSPGLADRAGLAAALGDLGQPWPGGPFGEPARRLLARHAAALDHALARFDRLVSEARRTGPPVLTHGEPHPGNIFRSRSGALRLIDWDTAGLALPERDLWDVAGPGSAEAAHYTGLTGRPVSPVAAEAYRLRWALDDIRLAVHDFRGPHERTPDTELAWVTLGQELGRIAR